MSWYFNSFGIFLAFLSAFLWAVASFIWNQLNKQHITPLAISLGKAVIAYCCFLLAGLCIGYTIPDGKTFFKLSLSGFLGISIGDTSFFYSLKYLGPRRSVLLTIFIPILTVLLAFIFLNERVSVFQLIGMMVCIYGTIIVIRERIAEEESIHKKAGIIWAGISIISCAASILLSKAALSNTGAFEASTIRLNAGVAGLLLYCIIRKNNLKDVTELLRPHSLKTLFVGSFFGTFLGIWSFIMSLKYTLASIAAVCNATTPIFILPLSYWFLKEKISIRAACGTVIAVAGGIFVLAFSR